MKRRLRFYRRLLRLLLRGVGRHFQARVLAGLLIVIPAVVTYLVLRLLVNFVASLLRPLLDLFHRGGLPSWAGVAISLPLTLVLLYLAGVVVGIPLGHRVVRWAEGLVERIPLVRLIYRTARQALEAFNPVSASQVSRVVFLEYPRPGVKAIGLVTGSFEREGRGRALLVYIPTVPNPTSGFLAIVDESQVEEAGMTADEAFKVILSGGILPPGEGKRRGRRR